MTTTASDGDLPSTPSFPGILKLLLVLVVAWAEPALAAPNPNDRVQMHHNPNRGVPYLKLSKAGAASSTATIAMRATTRIELDGSALLNVRGNLYPIDLDGDGRFGFVHFNGYRFMRVYDQAGRKLWQIDNPSGRVHRDPIHRDTLAVLDSNGNGTQEIVHCWVGGGRKQLVVRSGRTGAVLRAVDLDASVGSECQIAAFRVFGHAKPIILVAEQNRSGCPTAGNYIDTWGRTVAFDTELNRLWDRNTCAAGHYVYPVDGNADGYAGSIFIGRHLYDPEGNRLCSVDLGGTHADAVGVADLEPNRPGLEAVLTGADGAKAVNVTSGCQPIWSISTSVLRNPQQMALAQLDAASPAPTVAIVEKGSEPNSAVAFFNGQGRLLAKYPRSKVPTSMPFQNANLDGVLGTDELLVHYGRVLTTSGKFRLDTAWYWKLRGSKSKPVAPPTSYDVWAPFPFAIDLDRDGRDEIVTWGQTLIVVGKAT